MRVKLHFENNRNMNIPLIGFCKIHELFPLKRFYGTEFKERQFPYVHVVHFFFFFLIFIRMQHAKFKHNARTIKRKKNYNSFFC